MSPRVVESKGANMHGVTVITGTTHGIGLETARALVAAGHELICLVRDVKAAQQERDRLLLRFPQARVHVIHCDLNALASVREAARAVLEIGAEVQCLINNAGIVSMSAQRSADGFERVFAVNHLAHHLLTQLLMPRMRSGARVINVASCAHVKGTLDLGQVADPLSKPYRAQAAYAQSKLANVLHAFALARRMQGSGIRVNCLHPGVVRSNLLPTWVQWIKPLIRPGMIDSIQGARTSIHLALDERASGLHGQYLDEHQRVVPASTLARDVALQEALWSASEAWVAPFLSPDAVKTMACTQAAP